MRSPFVVVVAGRDPDVSVRYLSMSFLVSILFPLFVLSREWFFLDPFRRYGPFVLLGVFAAVQAYHNRSLPVCWAMTVGPLVPLFLGIYLITDGLAFSLTEAVVMPLVVGGGLGTLGWAVGYAVAWFWRP